MSNYFFKCESCGKILKSTNFHNTEDLLKEHIESHPDLKAEYETQNKNYDSEIYEIGKKYSKRAIGNYFIHDISDEEKKAFKKPFLTQEEILVFLKEGFQVHYYIFGFRNRCMRAELRGKNGEYIPDIKINVLSISSLLKKKLIERNGERQVRLCLKRVKE